MACLDSQSINLDGTLISEYEIESVNLSEIGHSQNKNHDSALRNIGNLFDKVDALERLDEEEEEKKVPDIDFSNLKQDDKKADDSNMSERETYRDKEELMKQAALEKKAEDERMRNLMSQVNLDELTMDF